MICCGVGAAEVPRRVCRYTVRMTDDDPQSDQTRQPGVPAASAPPSPAAGSPPTGRPAAPPLGGASPPPTPPADPQAVFAAAVAAERRTGPLDALAQSAAQLALVAGLLGVLAGPWLARSDPGLYLALAFDVVALAGGGLGVWGALRRTARLDYAVAGLIMGAAGLYFWISYATGPPPGST